MAGLQDVKTYSGPDGRARDEFAMADDLVMLVHHTQARERGKSGPM